MRDDCLELSRLPMCRIWNDSNEAAAAVLGSTGFNGSTSCGVDAREVEPKDPRVFGRESPLLLPRSFVLGRNLEPGRDREWGVFTRPLLG